MIRTAVSFSASLGLITWRIGLAKSAFYHVVVSVHELAHKLTARFYKWPSFAPVFWPNPWLVTASTKIGIPDTATAKQKYIVALSGPIVGFIVVGSSAGVMFLLYRTVCRWIIFAALAEIYSAYSDLKVVRT